VGGECVGVRGSVMIGWGRNRKEVKTGGESG
jgi:hypothetical protein